MRRLLLLLLAVLLPLSTAEAQRSKKGKEEPCGLCRDDPERMEAMGIVSHGPFPFFTTSSEEIEGHLGRKDFLWIETRHFRIGQRIKKWKIPVADQKAYRAELARFAEIFPEIDPKKTKTLKPELRLHLFAWRLEAAYSHLLDLFGYTDEQFMALPPEEVFQEHSTGEWKKGLEKVYLENPERAEGMPHWVSLGRYFGMPMKFEVLMMQDEGDFLEVKRKYIGHLDPHPQRWHLTWRPPNSEPAPRALWFGLSTESEKIKHDQHLHNALLHNVSINILDGFMLYLVEAPVWIRSGLGHYMTQRNSTDYNFYDLDEGAAEMDKDERHWARAVRVLVSKDKAPGIAELSRLRSFADISFEGHLVSWSLLCFLMELDREAFGKWLTLLKTDPNQSNNLESQRDAFQQAFGLSFLQVDAKWREWVLETYPVK